jgi:hypothetical protein
MTNPNLGGAEILSPHPLYSSSLLSFNCFLSSQEEERSQGKREVRERREKGARDEEMEQSENGKVKGGKTLASSNQ